MLKPRSFFPRACNTNQCSSELGGKTGKLSPRKCVQGKTTAGVRMLGYDSLALRNSMSQILSMGLSFHFCKGQNCNPRQPDWWPG